MKKTVLSIILVLFLFLLSLGIQFAINMQISPLPQRPSGPYNSGGGDRLLYYFYKASKGETLPEGIVLTEEFINSELS